MVILEGRESSRRKTSREAGGWTGGRPEKRGEGSAEGEIQREMQDTARCVRETGGERAERQGKESSASQGSAIHMRSYGKWFTHLTDHIHQIRSDQIHQIRSDQILSLIHI